jgi:hypothetical protein
MGMVTAVGTTVAVMVTVVVITVLNHLKPIITSYNHYVQYYIL